MKKYMLIAVIAFLAVCVLFVWWENKSHQEGVLPRIAVTLPGQYVIQAELVNTPEAMKTGLMHRKALAKNAGMWFDFGQPQQVHMWMKNTLIPLDMLFVDEMGNIRCIAPNTVPHSLEVITCPHLVRYVLEINGGLAEKYGLQPMQRVTWEAENQ